MTTVPWRPRQSDLPEHDLADPLAEGTVSDVTSPLSWQRADCCIAQAAYRVVLAGDTAQHPADLLLCGHHYRGSRSTLARMGATVYDERGRVVPADDRLPARTPPRPAEHLDV